MDTLTQPTLEEHITATKQLLFLDVVMLACWIGMWTLAIIEITGV